MSDRPPAPKPGLSFNKVLSLEDFENSELAAFQREALQLAPTTELMLSAKAWEIAMTARALRLFGAVRRDAEILGVGAGSEATLFYLTNHVRRVFATDLYAASGKWHDVAPSNMLVDPGKQAPAWLGWDRQRLVVQHMDARELHYPDDAFDGIFSNGSIEHFGTLDDVARAAAEIGRVLKPGGMATLSTEFRIHGPAGERLGIRGTILFTRALLEEWIIRPSGLAPVDEIDYTITPGTAAAAYPLREATKRGIRRISVALTHEGFVWTSIFLALTKRPRRES